MLYKHNEKARQERVTSHITRSVASKPRRRRVPTADARAGTIENPGRGAEMKHARELLTTVRCLVPDVFSGIITWSCRVVTTILIENRRRTTTQVLKEEGAMQTRVIIETKNKNILKKFFQNRKNLLHYIDFSSTFYWLHSTRGEKLANSIANSVVKEARIF